MSLLWRVASHQREFLPHDGDKMHEHYGIPAMDDDDDGDGHEWAANHFAHATPEDPEAENHYGGELDWRTEKVPLDKVEMHPSPVEERVRSVQRGWAQGADVPKPLYVHRGGTYHVVDGHHRSNAAVRNGETHIEAYTADSPYDHKPLPERD